MMYPFIMNMVETDGCFFCRSTSAPPSDRHLLSDLLSTLSLKTPCYGVFVCTVRLPLTLLGSPQRPALWGEEEPPHEVKAYQPDMPTEYGE